MAPEVYRGSYDASCDVYSFAIVLWELVALRHAFADKKTVHAVMFAVTHDQRPEIPKEVCTRKQCARDFSFTDVFFSSSSALRNWVL